MESHENKAPEDTSTLFQQATINAQRGHLSVAESIAKRIINIKTDHAGANHLLGLIAGERGQYDSAIKLISVAIKNNPFEPIYFCSLALALHKEGRMEEALKTYDRTIQLKPDYAEAHYSRSIVFGDMGRLEEALEACERAIQFKPDYAEAHSMRGAVLTNLGSLEEALEACERAIQIKPDYAEAHANRGTVLSNMDRLEEALAAFDCALRLQPGHFGSLSNRGVVLSNLGRFKEAFEAYKQAIQLKPDYAAAHYNYAMSLLITGDLHRGWKEFEWRWKVKEFPSTPRNFQVPQWDGSPLHGKTILLHAEQGFGDTIQFIRYVPLVAQAGGRIIVECQKALIRLFSGLPGIYLLLEQGKQLPEFDFHAPLMSLPRILGTTLDTIPGNVPYLYPPRLTLDLRRKLGIDNEKKNIGIVWRANPAFKNDRNRSFDLEYFRTLLDIPNTRWFGLQVGERAADLKITEGMDEVIDASPVLNDFYDTASVIKELDLVISVDTSVAHLAGSLGTPVWILLSFMADWRWLLNQDVSPWYPSARLFRQPTRGDWDSVFEQVGAALKELY
jgi:tetratricopeptide (TPR) repeat protein